jgi:hypothetical protein
VALTLPVTREIVVSEKRNYSISYSFCDLGMVPSSGNITAKAYPRFSKDSLFEGFLGITADRPTLKFFSPGQRLYRNTGNIRYGRVLNDFAPLLPYGVATEVTDAQATTLPHSIANGTLAITIPFGATFSRYVDPVTGVMSRDDMYMPNDPAKYQYLVLNNDVLIGNGEINITIDLGVDVPSKAEAQPTVCSVKVV